MGGRRREGVLVGGRERGGVSGWKREGVLVGGREKV